MQVGFPKKLNVPQRKMQNKSMGDFEMSGRKGRIEVDNISLSNKPEVGVIITKRVPGIRGESADICCE
jgi:hypothetical protein